MLAMMYTTCAAALAPLVTVRSPSISHQYLRPRASVAIGCTRDRPAAQQPPWRTCVPNYLTLSRIAGVPVLAAAFYSPRAAAARAPALIFGIISFTDFLDGYLARRWQVESALGAFLDPIADKFVVCATLVLLSGSLGTVVAAPTALIVCRELGISALRECVGRPACPKVMRSADRTALSHATPCAGEWPSWERATSCPSAGGARSRRRRSSCHSR